MKKLFSYQIIKQSFAGVWVWWLVSILVTAINLFAFPTSAGAESTDMLAKFAEEGLGGNGIIFITICAILFANVFITNEVDRGTLAILLNTPTTRLRILLSKGLVHVVLLLTVSIFVGLLGSLSPVLHNIPFDYAKWRTLIFLWFLYSFALGGITFAIGCWFNKSRYTLGLSSALLGSFFFLDMFAKIEDFTFCKYFTLQTLYDMEKVINGESVLWQMTVLFVVAVPFYVLGAIKFLKKDLPL